jgi:hypothetical protein
MRESRPVGQRSNSGQLDSQRMIENMAESPGWYFAEKSKTVRSREREILTCTFLRGGASCCYLKVRYQG